MKVRIIKIGLKGFVIFMAILFLGLFIVCNRTNIMDIISDSAKIGFWDVGIFDVSLFGD